MNIYIAGISGTGMGPLALMAKRAGFKVFGSDLAEGAVAPEFYKEEIPVKIGPQDGKFLKRCLDEEGVDWFVHSSAIGKNTPEYILAEKNGLRISKRNELIKYLVEKTGLKMVAVAGTHGKTTTTALITWASLKLGLPVAYLVGSTLPFGEAGSYSPDSKFLIYEADEYDRNFLKFYPWLSVITTVSYDHPDIYPTVEEYRAAFELFKSQSEQVIEEPSEKVAGLSLAGEKRRYDARLAISAVLLMCEEAGKDISVEELVKIMNEFPGVGRRFERTSPGVYSDYAHHPEEIEATIEMANEEAKRLGLKGVVAIYEPHQNTRQHEVIDEYKHAFDGAERVFWLPTYLTRENDGLKILKPADFIARLSDPSKATAIKVNEGLYEVLCEYLDNNFLLLFMSAGPLDRWVRKQKWE